MQRVKRKHNKSLSLRIYLAEHLNKRRGSAQHCVTLSITTLKLSVLLRYCSAKAVWAFLLCTTITFKEAAYVIGYLWCDYVTGFAANIKY